MSEPGQASELIRQAEAMQQAGKLDGAADAYRRAVSLEPDNAAAFSGLGASLAALGQSGAAAEALAHAARLAPLDPGPRLQQAILARLVGNFDEAERHARQALSLAPRSCPAWMELAAAQLLSNHLREAEQSLRKVLALEPGHAEALHNLGRIAFESGQEDRAAEFYRQALASDPGMAACWTNLGLARRAAGDFTAARDALERALEIQPAQQEALNALAGVFEAEGRYEEGLAVLGADAAAPLPPLLCIAAGRLKRRLGRREEALTDLRHLEDETDLDALTRMQLEFALGDLLDESGRYDEAWTYYRAANDRKQTGYDSGYFARRVERIIEAFPPGVDGYPVAPLDSDKPVFIVGMPRSGTSLVEQILASHSVVAGGGELTTLPRLVANIPERFAGAAEYPEAVQQLSRRRLARLGRAYLDALASVAGNAARVTDKMWVNFEYLGLIRRMLPGARIIHCRRDPRDTALSCYFQHFAGQMGVPFSYHLEDIADYYLDYARLMEHWRTGEKIGMFELDYELLVSEPERVVRDVLQFLGLEFEPACLEFHRSARVVNTASVAQVREPLYTRSVGRYRHYREHLEPLLSRLGTTDGNHA